MSLFKATIVGILAACSSLVSADDKVTVRAVAVQEIRMKALVDDEVPLSKDGSKLQVIIELAGDLVPGATQYGQLTYKAVDDKGTNLKQRKQFFENTEKTMAPLDRVLMWIGHASPPKDRIRLELHMDAAGRGATKIATLDGSVKLLTGTPVDLLIADVDKQVNKVLANQELVDAGLKITVTQYNPKGGVFGSYVKMKVTGKLEAMGKIDVVDGNGRSLSQGSGVSPGFAGSPASYEVFGDAPLPAGTKLKVTMLADVKEIEVPIKLKDVALP